MKLHPAQIAKELKAFPFFGSFNDELLLQVATMAEEKSVKKGEFILKEGNTNKCLYFLRSGKLEVLLADEVLAILQEPGEVIGEMSVMSGGAAASSVLAVQDCEFFVLDSTSFDYVSPKDRDYFKSLLYKIYSVILSDRLKKTNEKARKYEISNRENIDSQKEQDVGLSRQVVMLESEKKLQVLAKIALGGSGVGLDVTGNADEAEQLLSSKPVDLFICEDKFIPTLTKSFQNNWAKNYLLMTTTSVSQSLESLKHLDFIDNVISRNLSDKAVASKTLLTSINKVISKDLMGIEKYLSWGVEINSYNITSSAHRDHLKDDMIAHFQQMGIRRTILDRLFTVTEEMLMNAIYDAPVDSLGNSMFNHLSRREEIYLDSHQQSILKYACDGINLAVSVVDPFGALTKDIILNYLKTCYEGQAGVLNTNKGGAGRGLHQIIENCDLTIFNVTKGRNTEVICLFNLDHTSKEEQPGLHYFFN